MRALLLLLLLLPELCAAQLSPTQEIGRGRSLTPDGHIPIQNVDVLSDTHGLDMTLYLRKNLLYIRRNWRKLTSADAIGSSHQVSDLSVEFTIARDGSLSDAHLAQSSGDSVLDQAALEAVGLASPFAALPSNYDGGSLALRWRLHYDPDRAVPPERHWSANGGSVELLHAPERTPVAQAIYTPDPEFSEEARRKHVEGVVVLRLTVSESGDVTDVVVTKGLGYGLDEKATEAVRRWKFKPPLKDGQPISSTANVEVDFHLFDHGKK